MEVPHWDPGAKPQWESAGQSPPEAGDSLQIMLQLCSQKESKTTFCWLSSGDEVLNSDGRRRQRFIQTQQSPSIHHWLHNGVLPRALTCTVNPYMFHLRVCWKFQWTASNNLVMLLLLATLSYHNALHNIRKHYSECSDFSMPLMGCWSLILSFVNLFPPWKNTSKAQIHSDGTIFDGQPGLSELAPQEC